MICHRYSTLYGGAVEQLSRKHLTASQTTKLAMMSPHAASFISRAQLLPMHRRWGIRAAGGEDE